jgi:sialic acid synthase SpsE
LVIAEAGQNHCGDMELAHKLIILAKDNGADLVKFQLYDHNILYANRPDIQDVALSYDQAEELFNYGQGAGIEVFFSVFDIERVKWCEAIGVKRYKVAFSQRKNTELLDAILETDKPCIISSNRPTLFDTLYCVPLYPTRIEELDFSDLDSFDGFSDHTIGLDAAKIAIARGAGIIEKHFSIDHKTGIDAPWSMTPDELKELRRFENVVKSIQETRTPA